MWDDRALLKKKENLYLTDADVELYCFCVSYHTIYDYLIFMKSAFEYLPMKRIQEWGGGLRKHENCEWLYVNPVKARKSGTTERILTKLCL